MVQDLSKQLKIQLKKQSLENSVKQQILQIKCITGINGKTEYRGWTYKEIIVLKPGWIRDDFKFCGSEFYKLVTTVTRDEESKSIYNVPVGRCNQQTSVRRV